MNSKTMSQIVRKIIKSPKLPPALGPYSSAVQVGQTVYLSGSFDKLRII
jgi:enamine deaminase RidA (YjgF/YER057c/UK114 family)